MKRYGIINGKDPNDTIRKMKRYKTINLLTYHRVVINLTVEIDVFVYYKSALIQYDRSGRVTFSNHNVKTLSHRNQLVLIQFFPPLTPPISHTNLSDNNFWHCFQS